MANKSSSPSPGRPRPPPIDIGRNNIRQQSNGEQANPVVESLRRNSGNPRRSKAFDEPDEQSPLLEPRRSAENGDGALKHDVSPLSTPTSDESWDPQEVQASKSSWYMLLLTLCGLGLQMGWSVEMSNGSPYLLSLGLSKAMLALVWLAGPLSGVIVQPIVGMKSDRSRIRWGRRRPFIVGGALATIVSIMMLAWTREIVGGTLGLVGVDRASHGVAVLIMLTAVAFIYILDFAINVLQAAIRAYIVDCVPPHQQDSANAWVSRQMGIGNIIGMTLGFMDLPATFPIFGTTQFKVLCALASILMAVTVATSCITVPERDPTLEGDGSFGKEEGLLAFLRSLRNSVTRLPPQVAKVCQVQFLAWMGWFPFLFYTTTYIGEIYVEPIFARAEEEGRILTEKEINTTWDLGTRRGTLALLVFSTVTFIASIFLPFIIMPTFKAPEPIERRPATPMTPTMTGSTSASGYLGAKPRASGKSSHVQRFNRLIETFAAKVQVPGLTLRKAWLFSHLLFAACMFATFIVRSVTLATILVGTIGLAWAMTMWAPFALISAEISKRDAIRRGLIRPPPTREGNLLAANEDDSADQAGVVLGIHNVAISAPQVIATLVSSLIFKITAKPRGTPGDESVAWCFRFGGVCALLAAYLTTRVGEETEGLRAEDVRKAGDGNINARFGRGAYDSVGTEDEIEE